MMLQRGAIGLLMSVVGLSACQRSLPFAEYQREFLPVTPISQETVQQVKFINPYPDTAQHIESVTFDAGGNPGGHFSIVALRIAGKEVAERDISLPPGAALDLSVRYFPRDLRTTAAEFGAWTTGAPTRPQPVNPVVVEASDDFETAGVPPKKGFAAFDAAATLAGAAISPGMSVETTPTEGADVSGTDAVTTPAVEPPFTAIHRALINLQYDYPREGMIQLEVVGTAMPGPHGEITAEGGPQAPTTETCQAGGTQACFTGTFAIALPGLMQTPVETELSGAVPLTLEDGTVMLDLAQFPMALFVVKGNGPGEPLEGQPLSAISIAISGDEASHGSGTFDGSTLTIEHVGFRVRLYFSEMSLETLSTTVAPVDFRIADVTITTQTPFTDGAITLLVETVLGENPSGNPLADPLLSGAQVIVTMEGMLALP